MLQRVSDQTYLLPVSNGRVFTTHGYSMGSLALKHFRENTNLLALNVGLLLPTLVQIDNKLKAYTNEGADVSLDKVKDVMRRSAKSSLINFTDRLARVGVQAGFACLLIQCRKPYTDSMVYLWDLYPRMYQHYVRKLTALLRIPRFFATIFGARPKESEIAFIEANVPVIAVFEDSLKRNTIVLVGDIVVDTARTLANPMIKDHTRCVLHNIYYRVTTMLCAASGAALGRGLAGNSGEFWGEFMGLFCAPLITLHLTRTANWLRSHRRRRHVRSAGLYTQRESATAAASATAGGGSAAVSRSADSRAAQSRRTAVSAQSGEAAERASEAAGVTASRSRPATTGLRATA